MGISAEGMVAIIKQPHSVTGIFRSGMSPDPGETYGTLEDSWTTSALLALQRAASEREC